MILAAERSPGGEPFVVLVHGLGGSRHYWRGVLPLLAPTHGVVAVDLCGHGDSPVTDKTTVAAMAEDIDETLEGDLTRCVFVGHSMGTCVVAHLAATRPVGGVVLTGALPKVADANRGAFEERVAAARRGRLRDVAEQVVAGAFTAGLRASPDSRPGLLAAAIAATSPEGYARACEALLAYEGAALEDITAPTLYLVGGEDAVTPPALSHEMAARTPGAVVREIPGAAHWSALERPDAIGGTILGWLAGLAAGGHAHGPQEPAAPG